CRSDMVSRSTHEQTANSLTGPWPGKARPVTLYPSMTPPSPSVAAPLTAYQKFIVALLAFLQFTIVLDFMILSPLGALLLQALKIPPSRFGLVVSVYAFSAGTSGLLAAGFADRFDRKRLL